MKVLLINWSRRDNWCTFTALNIVSEELKSHGIETEIMYIWKDALSDKINDIVKEIIDKMAECDGLVLWSPVYFASISAEIKAVLDRLFMVGENVLRYKPAAWIASARRAWTTASIDIFNKYFTYAEMPIVSSRYRNEVHWFKAEDVLKDEEWVQIMKILWRNMAWLLKCIEAWKNNWVVTPTPEDKVFTNFIN